MMAFRDLLVPKWKHSRADVRLASLDSISHDISVLGDIARTDESAQVRMAAIERINDQAVLTSIIESERDTMVAECARKKREVQLKRLLSTSRDPKEVVAALEKLNSEKLIAAYLCEHDLSIEMQRALVVKVKNPHMLCKVTESGCASEIAESIVEQLSEKEQLEHVAKKASNKKIRLQAQRKIDTLFADPLAAEKAVTRRLEQCCSNMDIEVSLGTYDQALAVLEVSRNLWNKYDPQRQHALAPRFAEAEKLLLSRIEHCAAQKNILDKMEDLCRQLEQLRTRPVDVLEEEMNQLTTIWTSVDRSVLQDISTRSIDERFSDAVTALTSAIAASKETQARQQLHCESLERCCVELETSLEKQDFDKENCRRICSRWEALSLDHAPDTAMKKRFEDLLKRYRAALDAVAQEESLRTQEEKDKLRDLLARMESLAKAQPSQLFAEFREVARLRKMWEHEYPRARALKQELDHTFSQAYETFMNAYGEAQEQSSWQQWASDHVKERLLAEAQELHSSILQNSTLEHLARKVSVLQNQWRRAGRPGEKAKSLDAQFFEICRKIFDQGASGKAALLEELKTALGANSSRCAEEVKTIQKRWNDIGYLPPEHDKGMADVFYDLCNSFFEQRKAQFRQYSEEVEKNSAVREEICSEAEKLAQSTDWKATRDAFVQLQSRWDSSWPAPQKRSEELWHHFSSSRALFFERYDAFKAANDIAKHSLCEKAEQLVAEFTSNGTAVPSEQIETGAPEAAAPTADCPAAPVNFNSVLNEAIALRREWEQIGPASKARSEELWKRFNASLQTVFSKVNDEHERNRLRKAALVDEAEKLSASEDWSAAASEFSRIRAEWKSIGPAARRDEGVLWSRLQTHADTFFGRRRAHFDTIRENTSKQIQDREVLLEELEILVRVAGKGHLLRAAQVNSAAEILKRGMELRNKYEVEGDSRRTFGNISRRVNEIIGTWDNSAELSGVECRRLNGRFDELLRILRRDTGRQRQDPQDSASAMHTLAN